MSNATKAKSFLSDLLDDDDSLKQVIADANKPVEDPAVQYIVYYIGEKPDCVWEYHHKPDDGIPYGRLYGYWQEDKANKQSRSFKEHKSTNLKLMDFETFMDRIPPNRDQVKIFDSEGDFLLELI